MIQWFIKITAYANELLNQEELKKWPSRVLLMQKNWIGKKSGLIINFSWNKKIIPIFTTRPETIYGVTFLALSTSHKIISSFLNSLSITSEKKHEIVSFIKKFNNNSGTDENKEKDKKGIFTGQYAIHPLTGKSIPIFIGNFILSDYGTGALMGVPAHDQRDFLFAKKYQIKIKIVIVPPHTHNKTNLNNLNQAYVNEGIMINSNQYSNLTTQEARKKILDDLINNKIAEKKSFYRLKDWLISRQRYWGTPIPIIYCSNCGTVPVKESDLPIKLPTNQFVPLVLQNNFIDCICPLCHQKAKRETDTMDTFICSSWYFLRFTSAQEKSEPFKQTNINYFLPVDQYVGGIEHAILHLLYARFFTKVLRDINYLNIDEPFSSLITQGMVTNLSYYHKKKNSFLSLQEVQNQKIDNVDLQITLDKMSKSKKNGVDPEPIINQYGSDTLRLFILFAAPIEKDLEWNIKSLQGSYRFIIRFYQMSQIFKEYSKNLVKNRDQEFELKQLSESSYPFEAYQTLAKKSESLKQMVFLLQLLISKINFDFKRFHFNTIISSCMEFLNHLEDFKILHLCDLHYLKLALEVLSKLIFPIIPHMAEQIHHEIGFKKSIYETSLPKLFNSLLQQDQVTYIIQINGIFRHKEIYSSIISKNELINQVLKNKKITRWIPSTEKIKKIIFIPKKILNIVIEN